MDTEYLLNHEKRKWRSNGPYEYEMEVQSAEVNLKAASDMEIK